MTELISPNSVITRQITALLSHYGFDLRGWTPDDLALQWLNTYPRHWVRIAVIEALYQGRYKSVSIEQLLSFWAQRQHPVFHFNHEFERLICRKLPRHLTDLSKDPDEDLTLSLWNQSYWMSEVAKEQPQPSSPSAISKSSNPFEIETPEHLLDAAAENLSSNPLETDVPEQSLAATTELPPSLTPPESPVNPISVETDLPELSPLPAVTKEEEESIHSFTPQPDASGCYRKLIAVAHQSMIEQETA